MTFSRLSEEALYRENHPELWNFSDYYHGAIHDHRGQRSNGAPDIHHGVARVCEDPGHVRSDTEHPD